MSASFCATCGSPVGPGALFSDRGEPICERCNARAELEGGDARASRAIFASSGGALGLAVLAVMFDPCFVTSIASVLAGAATLGLLYRHPEHRARLGGRAYVAAALALLGMALAFVAPFAGVALEVWWRHRRAESLVAPTTAAPVEEEAEAAPPDPAREIFDTRIPDFIVALDARSAGREHPAPRDVASAHAAVIASVDAHLPALHDAFEAFLTDAETFSIGSNATDDAALTNRLVLLDAALSDAHAPYYIDALLLASADRRRVLSSSYAIERTRHFVSGETHVTALDLERIDTLSFERSLLGYTRPEVRYALVLVSRVERFLVQQALPSIHAVDESVIVRGYEDEVGIEWVTPFETAVHEDLRREAIGVVTERGLIDLAAAVVRRRIALDALEHALDGAVIREPDTMDYDLSVLAGAARSAGRYVAEVRVAQEQLDARETRATFDALEAASLASIARHEAQHRLDYEADRLVHVPDALAAYTGRTEHEDRVNHLAERSNAELSAYLSQVARDPERPLTTLVHVLTFVMNRHEWGRAESYAAIVLLEWLASALGITHDDFVESPDVMRGPIAQVYMTLRSRPPAEIAAAAARAWATLYGSELPPLREEP